MLLILASCSVLNGACMYVSVLCISAVLQLIFSSLYIFSPCSNCLFHCFLCWPHTAKQGLLSLQIITGFKCTNTYSSLTIMLYFI
jgi:hypothetical protein